MKRKIVVTDDGSSSIFAEEINQYYHSHFGAVQESMHIFIETGLCCHSLSHLKNISVLEIGFGTGLNALLSCLKADELKKSIYYETIELYPLTHQEAAQLNYPDILPYPNTKELFSTLHSAAWNKEQIITNNFTLHKRQISAIDATYIPNRFNLVYFDAFSPEVQPELWREELLKSIYECLEKDGILLTYCTKGIVKKTLKEIGFQIKKLPGPIGKREILRATKE